MQESIQLVIDSLPFLLKGRCLRYSSVSAGCSSVWCWVCAGLNAYVARLPVRWLARFYISVFRGTPLIAQLFMIYYGLPQFGIELDPIPAAMIGCRSYRGAYTSETLRRRISSIDKGHGKRRPVSV
jgi:cystine transport system permease protein